jgi:serine/threonine-protein kinase
MIGEIIGNYRVLAKLGQGGMGEVYLAEHRRIPRRVAIKILLPELSANQGVVERFFSEARATAMIHHPSIVEVLDCDLHEGRAFIVMSLLEGESLGARLRRVGRFAELADVADVGRQIAEGVGAAHAKGIIHRDLKPDNVFLLAPEPGSAGTLVKILDFGIAKLATDTGTSHTRTGAVIGTPTYMSPEQCRGAGRVDHRTDVYSLGCMIFEMVCGRPPFVLEGFGELIAAHIADPPPPPASLNPALPAAADAFIRSLLAKNPDERPQTMADVAARLSQMGTAHLTPAGPIAGATRIMAAVPESEPEPAPVAAAVPAAAVSAKTRLLPEPPAESPRAVPEPARPFPHGDTTLSATAGEAAPPAESRRRVPRVAAVAAGLGVAVAAGVVLLIVGRGHAPSAAAPPVVVDRPTPTPTEPVTVTVSGAPPELSVSVDGAPATLPIRLPRGPARHKLLFKAPGFLDWRTSLDGSQDRALALALVRVPPAAPPPAPAPATLPPPAPPPPVPAPTHEAATDRHQPAKPATVERKRRAARKEVVDYGTTDL